MHTGGCVLALRPPSPPKNTHTFLNYARCHMSVGGVADNVLLEEEWSAERTVPTSADLAQCLGQSLQLSGGRVSGRVIPAVWLAHGR